VDTRQALDIAWLLVAAALVMFMQAGFSSLESGLVRSKNSINVAAKNFADFCLTTAIFWVFGYALMFGTSVWGWFGSTDFFFTGSGSPWLTAFFIFQVGFAGTATTIMSGAVAERMRFSGYLMMALVMSALIYPVFGHWAWGSLAGGAAGWLEDLGFIDFAGSTVVHSIGGWMALAGAITIGPRLGRFGKGAITIHGHDLPMVTLGVFILWVGWFGFNGGSTLGMTVDVPLIIMNTIISGAFGGLVALALSWRIEGRADVGLTMNGSLAGLVAVTASANIVSTTDAAIIGAVAGAVMYGVSRLLARLEIDDVVGAVPVHLGAGVWGTLAVALFGTAEAWGGGRVNQLGVQALGVVVAFVWAFGLGFILLQLINRVVRLRIDPDGEQIGLNVAEHGASTEILDLLNEMDVQRQTQNYTNPVSVEPNTEVGQIAMQYNRVLKGINSRTAALQLMRNTASAANEATTVEDAIRRSLLEVCEATRWPVGHAYLVDEDDDSALRPTDMWQLADGSSYGLFQEATATETVHAREGLVGRVLAEGKPVWFDIATDGQGSRRMEAAIRTGLRTGFAFPVLAGTEIAAVLEFFTDASVAPDDDLLKVVGAVGTQLGRTVERTRSAESRFRTVVDNMPAIVLLRDLNGNFILVNRQYEAFYGLTNEAVTGKTLVAVDELTDVDMQPQENQDHDRQVIGGGRTVEQELTIRRGGRDHILAAVRFPIADHTGETVAVGGIELDVTDQKRHEAELADLVRTVGLARDKAMEATEAKTRFLASMSHELRTPMNAILGFTRIVRRRTEGVVPVRETENLSKILSAAEHLLALINDILDVSRIEAGREEIRPTDVSVSPLIESCLTTVEPLIDTDDVELLSTINPTLDTIFGDEEKLRQILINLLGNAVKFTEIGTVSLTVRSRGERVIFEVADSGIGIAPDALDDIFEEFHQEETPARVAGTGLGLTISRRLARLMGGDVTVESTVGGGSTFTLDLPQRYAPPEATAA
jgi:ammonium transporter